MRPCGLRSLALTSLQHGTSALRMQIGQLHPYRTTCCASNPKRTQLKCPIRLSGTLCRWLGLPCATPIAPPPRAPVPASGQSGVEGFGSERTIAAFDYNANLGLTDFRMDETHALVHALGCYLGRTRRCPTGRLHLPLLLASSKRAFGRPIAASWSLHASPL